MSFKTWYEKNFGKFKTILDYTYQHKHHHNSEPPVHHSKPTIKNRGRVFDFHGKFLSKQEAVEKEREDKRNFIRKFGKYWYVLRKKQ